MIEETIRAVKDAEKKAEELLAGARADSDALAKEAGDGAAAILEEARTAAKHMIFFLVRLSPNTIGETATTSAGPK